MARTAYVLGVNSAYHESAACLVAEGRILAAAEEERFTRIKHAKPARVDNPHQLPVNAIRYCLASAGIEPGRVDTVAYSLQPKRRLANRAFEGDVVEGGWGSPAGEHTFHRNLLRVPDELRALGFAADFRWLDHHLCHAASAFYPSPHPRAAVLTLDGIGETTSTAFGRGDGTSLRLLREVGYPASLGFLWEKLCEFLGFGEYDACKLMGLASYGDPGRYLPAFRRIVRPLPDGTFAVDNRVLRLRSRDFRGLEDAFGIPRRRAGASLDGAHVDVAAALQEVTTEIALHLMRSLHAETGDRSLCLAGGVALNCVTNAAALASGPFEELFVQPVAHDAGTAIGAALFACHALHGVESRQRLGHAYLGPRASQGEIEKALHKHGLHYERRPDLEAVVAELLASGCVVGWFQGAMEMGPRALGNRSLLADPRDAAVRERLNREIKCRESFRPFAPSVLAEEAERWFELGRPTPATDFMLLACPVRADRRSLVPAVVHVDGTSRVQTVRRETNPRFHALISAFFDVTGVPMVLNTSFNDNEPIVCTPDDALDTFTRSGIDFLAIEDFLVTREPPGSVSRVIPPRGRSS